MKMRALLLALLMLCAPAWGALDSAFQPGANTATANTASVAVTGTAQNLTCDVTANPGMSTNYRVTIRDTTTGTAGPPVTISVGSTTNTPVVAVVGNFTEMLGNTVEVFTWPPTAVISVIATTTGSTIRCTAGVGL